MKGVLHIKEERGRVSKAMFHGLKERGKKETFEELRSSACLDSTVWDRKNENKQEEAKKDASEDSDLSKWAVSSAIFWDELLRRSRFGGGWSDEDTGL